MKLVLREYLSMLRESGELDVLLPDLVLAMGLEPLGRPASGSRQFGVDLPAVGIDPEDPTAGPKLFLITIKRGNISRADWNTGLQSVRPSLDEILDSYLQILVSPEHAGLPKKIVLATGGDLRSDVQIDWANYCRANRNKNPSYGTIEFDFWGGDKIASLLDTHLFDEFMFPDSARKQLRKTIALVDQSDLEPIHFYALVKQILFESAVPIGPSAGDLRARRKAFQLIELSLLVVFRWCEDAGNLRIACLSAERTLLTAWDWMRLSNLLSCSATRSHFARLCQTHRRIMLAFADKLRPYAKVRDGLMVADEIENSLRAFEIIGLLGTLFCVLIFEADTATTSEQLDVLGTAALDVASTLVSIIENNPAAHLPRYDEHAIDIGIGLIALAVVRATGSRSAETWIETMCSRVMIAIKAKRDYPIATDSYEDLLAMRGPTPPSRDKLLDLSTLLPMLAEWMAILDMPSVYGPFREEIFQTIPNTDLQLWFPDASSEDHFYRKNAGHGSGATMSSLQLPEQLDGLRERMQRVASSRSTWSELSCLREGWTAGALVASRHFRTPLIPALWQNVLLQTEAATET